MGTSIQQDQEQAIPVREVDTTTHLPLHYDRATATIKTCHRLHELVEPKLFDRACSGSELRYRRLPIWKQAPTR
jgi:hypothetical protein